MVAPLALSGATAALPEFMGVLVDGGLILGVVERLGDDFKSVRAFDRIKKGRHAVSRVTERNGSMRIKRA